MADTTMYLLLGTMLGVLVALVLSIRRLTMLEIKSENLIMAAKRIDTRSIALEERILALQSQILSIIKKKKK